MARGHLFLIVVLLAGAAVAGLLAVTRTAQSSPAANATDPAIAYRLQKLDRLEASLEKQLATAARNTGTSAPAVVYTRAPSPVASSHGDDDEHEHSIDDDGDRDD